MLQSCLPNVGPGALKYRDVTPSSVKKVCGCVVEGRGMCVYGCLVYVTIVI